MVVFFGCFSFVFQSLILFEGDLGIGLAGNWFQAVSFFLKMCLDWV